MLTANVVFAIWFSYISADKLINNEERNNVALANTLSNWIWTNYGGFLSSAARLGKEEIINHKMTAKLDQGLVERTAALNIIKIKIYTLNGYTVFSSDMSQVAASKKGRHAFEQAKSGQVISKMAFRDKIYARKELIENRNILSSYIPIIYGKDKQIVAVLEMYKDVSNLTSDIRQTREKIIIAVATGLAILFTILFFVVKRADSIIRIYNKEQQYNTAKIEHQAYHDALTGLPNRVLFLDRLEHAMIHAKTENLLVALLFIDLDRFKQVNDRLGHESGDALLVEISKRIRDCTRPADTVARLSGDEFTVVLEGLRTIDLAMSFASRIIQALEKPVTIGCNKVSISCSIGIAVYPFEDDTSQTLIQKADSAMYYAKKKGKNNYHFYSPGTLQTSSPETNLEQDLINALDKNQLELYYQPKINLNDWKMLGMEALLRWNHPTKGYISPTEFIPILEENGLINKVGQWVIEEACRQNKEWIDSGLPPLRVAVNISSIQLNRIDFTDTVFSTLEKTGLDPGHLELELTESGLLTDIDANIEMFKQLRERGIRLALDDFGTGYSSLSYICKLPIDVIKIDREFINQISSNRETRSVVTAILSFAHGLRLDVVAEGVETSEQLLFLNAMRCTYAQGFLLSHPLPVDEFEKLYRAGGNFEHLAENIRKEWQTG